MRISNGMTKYKIRLVIIALVLAMLVMPVNVMATGTERNMVLFDPTPGSFTEAETLSGVRFQPIGQPMPRTNFPPTPVRDGYVFHGWRFSESGIPVQGEYLVLTDLLTTLEAIWYPYSQAPTTSPTPTPPPQGATPTPAPATPTPPPSKYAGAPNPPTNPITISLMIFGAVASLGIAAYGIVNLSMRQRVAVGKYRVNSMRYKRESRLEAILGIKRSRPPK